MAKIIHYQKQNYNLEQRSPPLFHDNLQIHDTRLLPTLNNVSFSKRLINDGSYLLQSLLCHPGPHLQHTIITDLLFSFQSKTGLRQQQDICILQNK